jgi:hypothetical protein
MNGLQKALRLGCIMAALVAALSGCAVATLEEPGEAVNEAAERLESGEAPETSSAAGKNDADSQDDGDGDVDGEEVDLEIFPDPIPWTDTLPGQDQAAPDPIPWQPDAPGCDGPNDK